MDLKLYLSDNIELSSDRSLTVREDFLFDLMRILRWIARPGAVYALQHPDLGFVELTADQQYWKLTTEDILENGPWIRLDTPL